MEETNISLLELERTEINRLFDKTEINYIFKQRKRYESGNNRKLMKSKTHHLRYVSLEMEILKLISLRTHLLKDNSLKMEMQQGIVDRISSLFKLVTRHFRNDLRPWLWYINFCKKLKLRHNVNQMVEALVCMHGDKPNTWKLAARWEFEENGSVESARMFLLRGLRFLPHSAILYKEAFRLELEFADQVNTKLKEAKRETSGKFAFFGQGTTDKLYEALMEIPEKRRLLIASGGLAEVVYEVAFAKIQDVELLIGLLKIARAYNFAAPLRRRIVLRMCSEFVDNPRTWDAVARNEIRGLRCFPDYLVDGSFPENDPRNTKVHTRTLIERIRRCVAVYTYAVKRLPTVTMWSLYLETLMKLNRSDYSSRRLPKFKENLLFKAFLSAHLAGIIEPKYYLYWVRYAAVGDNRRFAYVLRVACEKMPYNPGLWQMRLCNCLVRCSQEDAISVFKIILENFKSDPGALICLWTSVQEYGRSETHLIIEKLFLEGMKPGSPIDWHLKPLYLEWLESTRGIDAAREVYESFRLEDSTLIQVHDAMAELELAQTSVDVERVRRCYEFACEKFGSSAVNLWVDYAKMEFMLGDLEKMCDIQGRALEALNPSDADEFVRKYIQIRNYKSYPEPYALSSHYDP